MPGNWYRTCLESTHFLEYMHIRHRACHVLACPGRYLSDALCMFKPSSSSHPAGAWQPCPRPDWPASCIYYLLIRDPGCVCLRVLSGLKNRPEKKDFLEPLFCIKDAPKWVTMGIGPPIWSQNDLPKETQNKEKSSIGEKLIFATPQTRKLCFGCLKWSWIWTQIASKSDLTTETSKGRLILGPWTPQMKQVTSKDAKRGSKWR